MKTNMELRQVRDFGQIISDSLGFFKENFKPLFRSVLVICGFFMVLHVVTNVLMDNQNIAMTNSFRNINGYSGRPQYIEDYTYSYLLRVFIFFIAMVLSYVSVYLTTYCYIVLYKEKGNLPPTPEEVWGYFKFYFFRILGSGFLLGIIACFGMMLCLTGIYLIPAFSILLPIMVIENASFSYSFSRSFKLVSDYWWQTFGVVFVIGLIVGFLNLFLSIPGQILISIQTFMTVKNYGMVLTIISAVLKSLILFAYPLSAIAHCMCYFSLVETKEGTGLMDRIEMLGKTDLPDQLDPEEY